MDEVHGMGCLCPTCCERLGTDYYAALQEKLYSARLDGERLGTDYYANLAEQARLGAVAGVKQSWVHLPVWKLAKGYPVGVALGRLQATANTTQQVQYLLEPDGTEHVVEPDPHSPYADLTQRRTET